jgi:hypothetical protein
LSKLENFSKTPNNKQKYNSLLNFIDSIEEFNKATKNICKQAVRIYTTKIKNNKILNIIS